MTIEYTDSLAGVTSDMLEGFFGGWQSPHTPDVHLEIMRGSSHAILALDAERGKVVGFVTALTDGRQSAFISLLEVLPDYQGQGVGSELMRRMLQKLEGIPAVDLTCDPELQPFYMRFGMQRSVGMVVRNY